MPAGGAHSFTPVSARQTSRTKTRRQSTTAPCTPRNGRQKPSRADESFATSRLTRHSGYLKDIRRSRSPACGQSRRYDVAVDTTNYPYPLAVMRGSWASEPTTAGHCVVSKDFQFQSRPGLWGRTSRQPCTPRSHRSSAEYNEDGNTKPPPPWRNRLDRIARHP